MSDHPGKGYVVEFQLIDRKPIQYRDAIAEAELVELARELELAEAALAKVENQEVEE